MQNLASPEESEAEIELFKLTQPKLASQHEHGTAQPRLVCIRIAILMSESFNSPLCSL